MTNAETLRQLEVFMTLPMEQRQWQIEYDATLTEIANSSQMHDLQWEQVKELIKFKLHLNVCAAPPNESTPALQLEIIKLLDGFDRAPITLQRICELAVKPDQQYTKIRTYLRALVRACSLAIYDALGQEQGQKLYEYLYLSGMLMQHCGTGTVPMDLS